MIVKDEEEVLQRCLESVKDLVDEINIVDTGSSDGTVAIAKTYADNFKEIEWPESMSEARNVSLEMATCEWILIIDADEFIEDDQDFGIVHEYIETEDPNGLAFKIFNHLPKGQVLENDWVWQVRMWPNLKKIRYRGRVHNQISPALQKVFGEEPKLMQVEILVQHEGYNLEQDKMIVKYEQRLKLMDAEIGAGGSPRWVNYYRYQKGNALFMMRDWDEALYVFNEAEIERLTEENAFSLHIMGVHCNLMVRRLGEANQHSDALLMLWPHEPIAFMLKGMVLLEMEKYEAGLDFLLTAMQKIEKPTKLFKYNLDSYYIAAAAGEAALAAGRLGEAKGLFQLHLEKYPENEHIKDLEGRIKKRDEVEA